MIKKNLTFGLVVGGALIAYAAGQYLLKGKNSFILSCIGFCLLLLAWLKPFWLSPLRIIWEKIGFVMGIVNTYVVLTVFYYLILTPVAVLRRLIVNPIKRLPRGREDTYWQAHSLDDDNNFKNQY